MPHLFLIGPRASGKTTLAALLARELCLPCCDMDERIVQKAGVSIADMVQEHGWEAFRALETQVLTELCAEEAQVVATGGGVVLAAGNRELLKATGLTLYLQADAGVLLARLEQAPLEDQRPALSDLPLKRELETTLQEREPLYTASADVVLDAAAPLELLLEQALKAVKTRNGADQ